MKTDSCGRFVSNTIYDFLNRIEKTDTCWIWKGTLNNKTGYGQFFMNHKNNITHRFSWELHKGEIPKGKLICHTCDNRLCVNPEHLYIGTHKTNAIDRVKRNIKSFKKLKPSEKLDIDKVKYCRFMNEKVGINKRELANFFKIRYQTMDRAIERKTWRNV